MKRQSYLLIACILILSASCTKNPPIQYIKGLELIEKRVYNTAIDSFLAIPKEDGIYVDSAKTKIIEIARILIMNGKYSAVTNYFNKKTITDTIMQNKVHDVCIHELGKKLKNDMAQEILYATDTLQNDFIPRSKLMKLIIEAESTILKGIWTYKWIGYINPFLQDKKDTLFEEIYFNKKDTIFEGISIKPLVAGFGWDKGMVVYKNVRYSGKGIWELQQYTINIFTPDDKPFEKKFRNKLSPFKFNNIDEMQITGFNNEIRIYKRKAENNNNVN